MSDEPKDLRDSITPDEPAIADLPPETLDAQQDDAVKGGNVSPGTITFVHHYDKASPVLM